MLHNKQFNPLQPPLANLDGMFQHIDKVMDVSGRLLSILDQAQMKPSDPQFLETVCKYLQEKLDWQGQVPQTAFCAQAAITVQIRKL